MYRLASRPSILGFPGSIISRNAGLLKHCSFNKTFYIHLRVNKTPLLVYTEKGIVWNYCTLLSGKNEERDWCWRWYRWRSWGSNHSQAVPFGSPTTHLKQFPLRYALGEGEKVSLSRLVTLRTRETVLGQASIDTLLEVLLFSHNIPRTKNKLQNCEYEVCEYTNRGRRTWKIAVVAIVTTLSRTGLWQHTYSVLKR